MYVSMVRFFHHLTAERWCVTRQNLSTQKETGSSLSLSHGDHRRQWTVSVALRAWVRQTPTCIAQIVYVGIVAQRSIVCVLHRGPWLAGGIEQEECFCLRHAGPCVMIRHSSSEKLDCEKDDAASVFCHCNFLRLLSSGLEMISSLKLFVLVKLTFRLHFPVWKRHSKQLIKLLCSQKPIKFVQSQVVNKKPHKTI